MLTLPIEAAPESRPESRVLIIGRSENVLSEAVQILRGKGQAAGASNDFADVMNLFDMTGVDIVVFGGMVPPDTKELLRKQISDRNPAMTFIQGFAGIAGVIVAQVQASLTGDARAQTGLAVTYDPQTRTVDLHLDRSEDVQVVAWWATSFTPPEPRSTSQVLLDAGLPAGQHAVTLPGEVPSQASFVTVTAGDAVQALIVGPMPAGTTMASFPQSPAARRPLSNRIRLVYRDRLLDLGCRRVGGGAGLVGVDDAGARCGVGHRGAGYGAHPWAAGGVSGEHDRIAGAAAGRRQGRRAARGPLARAGEGDRLG
jgi:hypothetical protein